MSGGPFERAVKFRQKAFRGWQQSVAMRVLAFAVRSGRISDQDFHRITVHVISPDVAISDHAAETNRLKALFDAKVLSPQTWCQKEGLDPKIEAANWKAWDAQHQDQGQNQGGDSDDGNPLAGEAYSEAAYRRLTVESRDGLVEKTITDKNGDKRTVWVRADSDDRSPMLPAKSNPGAGANIVKIEGKPTEEHRAIARKYIESSRGLSDEQAAKYQDDMSHALSVLPEKVYQEAMKSIEFSIKQGRKGIVFHPKLKDLRAAAMAISKKKSEKGTVGFTKEIGMGAEVHIDGDSDPRGTYVHELWHAAGSYYGEHKSWIAAWKKEIVEGKYLLSTYALKNSNEGIAEFGRILSGKGVEYMEENWPKCVKACREMGLI